MKKLFFLITTLECGGAERVLVNLVNNLDNEKYKVAVRSILGGGVFEKELRSSINYRPIIKIKNQFLRKCFSYLISFLIPNRVTHFFIVRGKFDVEIAYLEGPPTKILSYPKKKRNSKSIAFVHTDFNDNYSLNKVYKNHNECLNSYKNYDKVVFVSEKALNGFSEKIGYLPNSMIINNIINSKEIIEKSREEIEFSKPKNFLFISVGRLCYQKGYDRLIEVVSELNKKNLKINLWIIGEGNDRLKLEKLIKEKNINNIKLIGFKKNPYKYIKKADMYICSSRVEGYSTVINEALVLGIPVLTTDCAGMSEILDNGKYGKIVENSTEGIKNGIGQILNNSEEYKQLKLRAMEKSKTIINTNHIKYYEDLF